ncbi:putative secreted protein [Lachnellula suecica]|uniref:Putative secreted protein n=1 Tax=Lachnellula suecica TaxID=602035 RepID=A0A8T9CCI6_9HELO|nr:putative secreted protein [Lachnellula suecica]
MFTKSFAPLVATLAFASAAPAPAVIPQDPPYYLKPTARAPGTAVDGGVLNAVNGGLFIGQDTTTDCPGSVYPCDTFTNITAITVSNSGSGASMDAYVPGGQIAYINATGEFGYTAAHAQNVPSTATQKGFTRIEVFGPRETYATVTFKGSNWLACPVEGAASVYQVNAAAVASKTGCVGFEMAAIEVGSSEPQAYEYVAPYTVS